MNPIATANKLKTLRTLKGLTQQEVSKKAKLDLSDYEAMELGKTAISEEKLSKACKALGVDVKEWFETDNARVYVNESKLEAKDNATVNQNQQQCENCYIYNRTNEDIKMMDSMASTLKILAEKLDNEALKRQIRKIIIEDDLNNDLENGKK